MDPLNFGTLLTAKGATFRLWAPKQQTVLLRLDDRQPIKMEKKEDGWFSAEVGGAGAGSLYKFVLADGLEVPDPASRFQPDGPHGFSQLVDPQSYEWTESRWAGRPWEESVVYELHIGTFTPDGTYRAVIDRLDHLHSLGVTVIQLMPVNDFPGSRGWGYDGVLPYAPKETYGRPDDLKALVDAAHARGMSVFLDVVYNHFGPDGNYLPAYTPLFTDRHKSPWGAGINYDGEGSACIREFAIRNALYWLDEFRLDGLRFDAVHAIIDDSSEHLIQEIARRIRETISGRHVHLVLENEHNDSSLLARDGDGRPPLFTAQWNDDIHHVLHVAATGEDFGYYADYADDAARIGRGLAEGFVYQGEHMPYRGSARGKPSNGLPPTAFISFIQNHDQIGNRAFGDRMSASQPPEALRAIAAVYLLAPQIPMLFMGEEWAARQPFPFFCDFNEVLNENVRKGRREELKHLPGFSEGGDEDQAPDATLPETFLSAKLNWEDLLSGEGASQLSFYRELLAVRRLEIMPRLAGASAGNYRTSGQVVAVAWPMGDGSTLALQANLSPQPQPAIERDLQRVIWRQGDREEDILKPWSVTWSLD